MSEMSFKQAKDLVERMEFSEIALKRAVSTLEKSTKTFDKSSKIFDNTLKQQEEVLTKIPKNNKKISYMFIAVALNIGFILGLVAGKYVL
jgi:hypothetical protein